jgi:hypothetical protein
LIPLLALAGAIYGCGGGGSDEPVTSGALFITDSLDTHDHVWVTIHNITLAKQGGGTLEVFDDPVGITVDLKNLRDGSGERYLFLRNVRAGTYTAVTFTMDKDLVLFASGSKTGEAHVFQGHNGTTVDLNLAFAGPVGVGPTQHLAIDFDLTNWTDVGAEVTGAPFLVAGTGVGLSNLARHESSVRFGTVRSLTGTAPDQTFDLVSAEKHLTVMTDSNTVIYGFASLQTGQDVRVRGRYSTDLNAFVASSIRLVDVNDHDDDEMVEGTVASFIALDGTIEVNVNEVENFVPMNSQVHVVTNGNTVFSSTQGGTVTSAQFFLALLVGANLEVDGEYDALTNTLVATRIEYTHEDPN